MKFIREQREIILQADRETPAITLFLYLNWPLFIILCVNTKTSIDTGHTPKGFYHIGISSEYLYSLVMWKFIFNMREILLNELVTQENIGINQK